MGVAGEVDLALREADRMTFSVDADAPSLLVVGDNWFPAWRASVNGEDAEVLRAYHTLRAVAVPAGTSTVEMWYESPLLQRSRLASLLILLGLLAAGGLGFVQARNGSRDNESDLGSASPGASDPEPAAAS